MSSQEIKQVNTPAEELKKAFSGAQEALKHVSVLTPIVLNNLTKTLNEFTKLTTKIAKKKASRLENKNKESKLLQKLPVVKFMYEPRYIKKSDRSEGVTRAIAVTYKIEHDDKENKDYVEYGASIYRKEHEYDVYTRKVKDNLRATSMARFEKNPVKFFLDKKDTPVRELLDILRKNIRRKGVCQNKKTDLLTAKQKKLKTTAPVKPPVTIKHGTLTPNETKEIFGNYLATPDVILSLTVLPAKQ